MCVSEFRYKSINFTLEEALEGSASAVPAEAAEEVRTIRVYERVTVTEFVRE